MPMGAVAVAGAHTQSGPLGKPCITLVEMYLVEMYDKNDVGISHPIKCIVSANMINFYPWH